MDIKSCVKNNVEKPFRFKRFLSPKSGGVFSFLATRLVKLARIAQPLKRFLDSTFKKHILQLELFFYFRLGDNNNA